MSFLSVLFQKLKEPTAPAQPVPARPGGAANEIVPHRATGDLAVISQTLRRKAAVTLVHGRAGTGKTTLIRELVEQTQLNYVIVAPTGVAALNAGGQTIHSFFGLPPRMVNLEEIEPSNRLKSIVRRLDFIVLDEISMVRADLLDAVDPTLRINSGRDQPFGGIPMLFVGDFLQLSQSPRKMIARFWSVGATIPTSRLVHSVCKD